MVRYSMVSKGMTGHIIKSVANDGEDTVTIKLNTPQASFLEKPNDESILDC